ncbi:pinin-like [Liolophura sinensis]|uniref:pinin-like n=1 Tax=Liolophura sinensis TaxID=3198878 RepID=UPI00315834CC
MSGMAEFLEETHSLQTELKRAKESLKDVDENIKKLTGRDPVEQRNHARRVSLGAPMDFRSRGPFGSPVDRRERRTRTLSGPGERGRPSFGGGGDIRGRLFALARQDIGESEGPPAKRRIVGGAFSRLGPARRESQSRDSGDEEDLPNKPTVQSSVVPAPGMVRTRKESIDQQNKDEKGKARNRRMFGLLLGTLQQFRTEAKESKDKDEQRRQIEVKLEDKAKQEKEDAQKERQQLFKERRDKQAKVQLLEQKMELVNTHEEWEKETLKLKNFLRTKAKPHLFYKPRSLDLSDSRVKHTHKVIDGLIKDRRKKLEEDLKVLSQQLNKETREKTGEEESREGDGHHEDGVGRERDGVGHSGKDRGGKRVENKENMKRKVERKRRKSFEADEEDGEEEELVSVGVVERVTGENGEGSEGGKRDQTHETNMEGQEEEEEEQDSREITPVLAQVVDSEDKQGQVNYSKTADTESDGMTEREISRRVVLAEDEEENPAENIADGDPEQADE